MEEDNFLLIIFFTLYKAKSGFVVPLIYFKGCVFIFAASLSFLFPLIRCHKFHPSESLLRSTHRDNSEKFSKYFFC